MTKRIVALPNKPSALILLALDDLNKIERLKGYDINMGVWHNSRLIKYGAVEDECTVCMSGAVMANTLGYSKGKSATPESFSEATRHKLYAINSFRIGQVSRGFEELGRSPNKGYKFDRHINHYEYNRRQFKWDMRKLSRDLAREGL